MVRDWQMSQDEWILFNHDEKLFKFIADNRVYCKCGHSIVFSPNTERKLCTNCRYWVYKDIDKQREYDEKVEEEKKRLKKYKFRKELMRRL